MEKKNLKITTKVLSKTDDTSNIKLPKTKQKYYNNRQILISKINDGRVTQLSTRQMTALIT